MDVNNCKEVKESIFLIEDRHEKVSPQQDFSSSCSCKSGTSGADEEEEEEEVILPAAAGLSFLGSVTTPPARMRV